MRGGPSSRRVASRAAPDCPPDLAGRAPRPLPRSPFGSQGPVGPVDRHLAARRVLRSPAGCVRRRSAGRSGRGPQPPPTAAAGPIARGGCASDGHLPPRCRPRSPAALLPGPGGTPRQSPGRRHPPVGSDRGTGVTAPARTSPGDRVDGRRASRSVAARGILTVVRTYQLARTGRVSPCRFTPTCSQYAVEAVERHGARRGSTLALRRLTRCRPGGPFGSDPVPD